VSEDAEITEPECAHTWTWNYDTRMLECDHCELSRFGKPPARDLGYRYERI
jgi:hypothetical protein